MDRCVILSTECEGSLRRERFFGLRPQNDIRDGAS